MNLAILPNAPPGRGQAAAVDGIPPLPHRDGKGTSQSISRPIENGIRVVPTCLWLAVISQCGHPLH